MTPRTMTPRRLNSEGTPRLAIPRNSTPRILSAAPVFAGRPWYTTAALVLTDAFALVTSVGISVAAKAVVERKIDLVGYLQLWPFLFVFLIVYAAVGLYSVVSVGAPEELQRATISSTVLFVCLAAITVSMRGARQHITWTLLLALLLSVALLPLFRECVRQLFSRKPWWGYPAVVFGAGPTGTAVVKAMFDEPGLGLKPIAVLDDTRDVSKIRGVPIVGGSALAPILMRERHPAYAVFAMPDIPQSELLPMIERYGENFSHVLVFPHLTDFASMWVRPKSFGGMLGLEIRQQALLPEHQLSKRVLDLMLTFLGAAVAIPLCAAIALWVKFDSRGPVFYGQRRIGRHGDPFTAWKFRSMSVNADALLEKHLDENPELRAEWERDHKLKNDPRVTRAGRFLRKTSLDELPQLWNVLKGDMSMVGPRPIVDKEVEKYGSKFELYQRVKGGITGLWQVSGRNDTSYDERINLDLFYVRNWSVWLDFCILFRTIAVVLFRKGAY